MKGGKTMHDDASGEEKNSSDYIWEPNRTSASKLPTSEHVMDEKRKEMIRKGLEFEIVDVRSYAGYKGDMLIAFITLKEDTMQSLKNIAESLGMEVVVKRDPLLHYQIYCITPGDHIYDLKI